MSTKYFHPAVAAAKFVAENNPKKSTHLAIDSDQNVRVAAHLNDYNDDEEMYHYNPSNDTLRPYTASLKNR